jgi:hypothetical protein
MSDAERRERATIATRLIEKLASSRGRIFEGESDGRNSERVRLGQIETRFPRPSVGRKPPGGPRPLARRISRLFMRSCRDARIAISRGCWVLSIQGLETYILQPREPADLDLLIGATAPQPSPWISTVIGVRGPVAPPEFCNGLMIPIVAFDQIYTFSRDALIEAIPRPERIPAERFQPAARELFDFASLNRATGIEVSQFPLAHTSCMKEF